MAAIRTSKMTCLTSSRKNQDSSDFTETMKPDFKRQESIRKEEKSHVNQMETAASRSSSRIKETSPKS